MLVESLGWEEKVKRGMGLGRWMEDDIREFVAWLGQEFSVRF